jgi:hypothetical protein
MAHSVGAARVCQGSVCLGHDIPGYDAIIPHSHGSAAIACRYIRVQAMSVVYEIMAVVRMRDDDDGRRML